MTAEPPHSAQANGDQGHNQDHNHVHNHARKRNRLCRNESKAGTKKIEHKERIRGPRQMREKERS
jgi:hypothetical protein